MREILSLSALILAVLLVRAIFKNRVPKRMLYALWLVVLLKLCLPGTLVSLPVLPAEDAAVPAQSAERPVQTAPVIQRPAQTVTKPQTPAQQPVSPVQETAKPAAKPLTTAQILQIAWFSGSALLGLWLFGAWAVFTIRLHRDRRFLGKRGGTRIYVSGAVKSPCLAGFIPAVYLTEDVLQTDEAELILRHELTHLRHLDFLWSFCRTAAVIAYWWNPFIWLAAICSKRDAELACDEAVAAKLPESKRLAYARAILAQAPRKTAALSLAGPPVKERILFLTKKRRTSALCVILALLIVASATGCSFAELTRQKSGESIMSGDAEETEPPAAEETATEPAQTKPEEKQESQPEATKLPTPTASMFGLTGREATLYDAAVSQKYPRSDNDIVLPSLRVRGSFEEDGKTVVICDLHYDFYYDYTGPGWEWNGGGATTYLRAELETRSGVEICTGFAEYPSGSLSDWIRDHCAPLAMQDADGAWVLPETAENWFPSDGSMLNEYLAAAEAMPEPAAVMQQTDFEAHMLTLSDGKTAEELTIDSFPDVLAEDAALESFLRDTPEDAALCCATYLVENMWYGDGENEPYTPDFALTALGRFYVLSMQYLMETYNDSTWLLSALLLHTFSPEEWLYQFWGVVGGIAFAKEGFTLDSVYYDEHPIEKQCMTALLRSPKWLHVATLFDYVNPVDNERCDADHSALYDFLAEGKADDRLHIEPAGATREDLLAACTETAHWEVEGGTDTTILHITPEHGQELRLVYRFGEN